MNKAEKIQQLIKEQGFTENDLKDLPEEKLNERLGISDTQEKITKPKPKAKAESKTKTKKYYPKKEFLNQSLDMVDRKSKIPKTVKMAVDYRIIKFKHGTVKFVKDQEVSKNELALMSDYQKEYYLDAN